MSNVSNINGVPLSSVSSIAGVPKGSLSAFNGVALETTYDLNVFLVGGQSNSDGRVAFTSGPAYLQDGIVDGVGSFVGNRIIYDLRDADAYTNGRTEGANKYAFNHVALYQIAQELPNVTTVQITAGGSQLSSAQSQIKGIWNADYASIPSDSVALLHALQLRFEHLQRWVSTRPNLTLKVRGLIWHQGESDAWSPADTEYLANWTALVSKVRTFVGDPNMPVFYGTIPSTSADYNATVRAAMLSFAASDPNAYCRDNDDLTMYDGVHFDAASCNTFGDWTYSTFMSQL